MMSKMPIFLFVLALMAACISARARGENLKAEECGKTFNMNYDDAVKAFQKIKEGMGPKEVCELLGRPNHISGKDPDQTWYDELWTYDFRKLAGYPKSENRKADWEGKIMFLHRKVVHTRKIGWLE